jgi:hypothetical protein
MTEKTYRHSPTDTTSSYAISDSHNFKKYNNNNNNNNNNNKYVAISGDRNVIKKEAEKI